MAKSEYPKGICQRCGCCKQVKGLEIAGMLTCESCYYHAKEELYWLAKLEEKEFAVVK